MTLARGREHQHGHLREKPNALSSSQVSIETIAIESIGSRLDHNQNCESESQLGLKSGRATECIEESKVRSPSSRRAFRVGRTRRRLGEYVELNELCHTQQLDIFGQRASAHFKLGCRLTPKCLTAVSIILIVFVSQISNQQLLYFNSRNLNRNSNNNNNVQHQPPAASNRQLTLGPGDSSSDVSRQATALAPWRSQAQRMSTSDSNNDPSDSYYKSALATAANEARGALSRNLYSRVARNASLASSGSGGNSGGSWHFPRISPEQAAEVLLTGAQVINKLAQVESPLNFCRTPDNQEGECSDIRKCIWLVLDKARLKQSVCLRNLIIPAVCCPISSANNTPIANMIQSTLEPVLFRPKGNAGAGANASKQKIAPSSTSGSTATQATAGSGKPNEISPPPSASQSSAFFIKNPTTTTSTTTTSTSSEPLHSTTSSTQPPIFASTVSGNLLESSLSSPANQLFQESPNAPGASKPNSQYVREKSSKYSWANETCGESARTRTGRILGGSDSKLGQWPWMTAMYLNKHRNAVGEFWCGGALINRRFILTAAHCLSDQRGNRYKNDQVTIKLGGVDLVRHQAPADILRNAIEPDSGQSQSSSSRSSSPLQADQFLATHLNTPQSVRQQQNRRTVSTIGNDRHNHRSGHQLRSGEDDEEFSWASFITKALGFVGVGSGSGSSSSSSSNGPASSGPAAEGSTKALDGNQNKRQQLAAHAKRTYFKEYKVANIKQHPNFQRNGFYNDIGLIELKSDVDFDELISPICLPTEHDLKRDLSGYMATVLGWGTLSYLGQGSKLLQQVAMPVWSNKDCDAKYLQKINENFLCAGFLAGGKDACQGDSGGPLMVSDQSGRWTLHGVVSFGKQCGLPGFPGVYSRVTQYLDWIEENTRRPS